jgi:hypothetical protein
LTGGSRKENSIPSGPGTSDKRFSSKTITRDWNYNHRR